MSAAGEQAVEEFLKAGRRISRVPAIVLFSESELLEYLKGCGVTAQYRAGDARPYLCRGQRKSVRQLVAIANKYRSASDLPPIAADLRF